MKEVVIKYDSFWWIKKELKIQVPTSWSEQNEAQFKVCCDIYVDNISDVDFISRYFGIKKRIVKKISRFPLYKLTELVKYASDPNGISNSFYMKNIPGTNLVAPLSKLKNVTFEHFAIFDTFFFTYVHSKKIDDAHKFIASLYLKEKENITSIDFDKRVKYIAQKVDENTINVIFMNYIFILQWLAKSFPSLFETKENSKIKQAKKSSNIPDWNALIDNYIGDDIIHYNEYKQTSCILIFKKMNARIKASK